jgi:hypothetical protein
MNWLSNPLLILLTFAIVVVFLLALLSPFESLGWWSGWSRKHLEPEMIEQIPQPLPNADLNASYFIVFFSGVIAFSGGAAGNRERRLLENIVKRVSGDTVVISDVFPYSVSNNPLHGERVLSWLWTWLDNQRKRFRSPVNIYAWLIILRNIFQVAISGDRRYGPINNVGVAIEIATSLLLHGYQIQSGKPIYIIGYSGGAQVAVGSARYLHKAFAAPIRVISIGGVISDDPGIAEVDHLYHLQGSKDIFPWIGNVLYPGRWPIVPHSNWNQAKRNGKVTVINMGPVSHFGRHDYFSHSAKFSDGKSHAEKIAEVIANIIK